MKADHKVRWRSRRAFLAGAAGAAVALPALHSLLPRRLWAQETPIQPKRFLAWFFPCGVPSMDRWTPNATGAGWEPTELLEAVASVRERISIISGLRNEGQGPDHTYGTGAFLTGRLLRNSSLGGPSIDQVIADGLQQNGTGAPVHSVQLGIPDNICEPNIDCFPCNNITYNVSGAPITKRDNAADAFDALFADFTTPNSSAADAAAERRARRLSVLDAVIGDANSLRPGLSYTDRLKLDNYLDAIRTTEENIERTAGATISCEPPTGIPWTGDIDGQIDAFADVMSLAFECDLTRVVTFMAASGATGKSRDYPNFHLDITHRQIGDWEPKFIDTVKWEVQKFAAFVERLSTKTEVDGVTPILDNSALFFSSEISDGNSHNHSNMPVLIAGGLGGAVTQGVHTRLDGEYFADLFMYLAGAMGVPLGSFGDNGAGRISSL